MSDDPKDEKEGKPSTTASVIEFVPAQRGQRETKGPTPARPQHEQRLKDTIRTAAEVTVYDPNEKLTPQEEEFAIALADGASCAQAYHLAWPDEDVTQDMRKNRGFRIAQRGPVAREVIRLCDIKDADAEYTGQRIRRLIQRQLEDIATSSNNDAARIAALEKLGKLQHVKAFEERQTVTISNKSTSEEVQKAIAEKIAKLKKA